MATVSKFEDLVAWQKAETLAEAVYVLCRSEQLSKDFALRDQMQRAAISIVSNIAEGFERDTTPDFIHFLYIAKGSAGELRTQLHLASRVGLITSSESDSIRLLASDVGKVIAGLIAYLKRKQQNVTRAKSH